MSKRYYVVLYNEDSNEVMFVPNTPKGRKTLTEYKTDCTKAFRVGAKDIDNAYEVFKEELGINAELVKIAYKRKIPVVQEIEL